MKTIYNYSVKNKKVLLRVDLNVPTSNEKITDNSRIQLTEKTIKKLIEKNNKIFLLSHFGRPKGVINKKYSLEFICNHLKEQLGVKKIHFLKNFDQETISNMIKKMHFDEICLFENLRFDSREESNDINFSREISKQFDIFINDAFSASHRHHASIIGIPKFLPSLAGYGLLNEIKNVDKFLSKPQKPNLAIIGGSKVSTKIDLINNLSELFDTIIIGGAMANTFLYANKIEIGKSIFERDLIPVVSKIIEKANNSNCKILLPVDVVCANSLKDKKNIRTCDIKGIFSNQMIFDVGNKTIKLINKNILRSRMILWNGPLGAFEHEPFNNASEEIANFIKKNSKKLNITSLAGGGDTIAVIKAISAESGFSYISKAGGAFLQWLEGKELPGIIALKQNYFN